MGAWSGPPLLKALDKPSPALCPKEDALFPPSLLPPSLPSVLTSSIQYSHCDILFQVLRIQ